MKTILEKAQKIADLLENAPLAGAKSPPPARPNAYVKNGVVLVSRVKEGKSLKRSIAKAVELIGGFEKIIRKGDRVFLKPNLNSDDPYPASTDPAFIGAVTELCYEHGAEEVIAGDCSGCYWLPTERVLKLGVRKAVEDAGGKIVTFDTGRWIRVNIPGKYMKSIGFAECAYDYDKIIFLPCMKVHRNARFTLSLKLTMGYIHMRDRFAMHASKLEEKLAEINLAVQPDLIIMDGRKCFTTSGPDVGHLESPGLILASGDRIAIDVEALKVLKSYKANNKLTMPIWELPQISHAVKLGLGVKGEKYYKVIKE